ncbi:MFS transporter [Hyphomicrobium sp. CS1BSMeth3]|uniref:MFS transporter n=1 Tax=Hyphomicrobium sp. CS1BSMeth3 TaxID=1892844 RepID=UPI000931CF65|nr:MFS transporter [Hyphomicrobium sp. CS1BSMeth3]
MTGLLRPVTALLLSASILMMGNGLFGVLVPIRANIEHFSSYDIGLMGSSHFAGLMIGCLLWPRVIGTVGHIRAFAALTALATMTPLLHAIWTIAPVWWILRALNGLVFAGLFMIIESWLTGASQPETRGRVLGAYAMTNLTVVTGGMLLISTGNPASFELFSLVAILYSLAAVPIALTPRSAPQPPPRAKMRLGWLMTVSPAAVFGCFAAGIVNSGFWTFSPLFAQGAGLSVRDTSLFMSLCVLGGAISQWPIGRLSDQLGRRAVGIVVCTVAAAGGASLYLMANNGAAVLFLLGALYGAMAFTVYTLCVAHANDLVHRKRAVEVSSGLLLVFSVGAILGPMMASALMQAFGHGGLFLHTAIAHASIAIVMLLRVQVRPKLPTARTEPFVVVPKTTPAVFELDPRAEQSSETSKEAAAVR